MGFTFTRVPGTKTQVDIQSTLLTLAQNTLVIIGHMAASGSTAATTTGNTTSGSNQLTSLASVTNVAVGQTVSGAGIPANTTVSSISGSTVTMSANATATATGVSVTFTNALATAYKPYTMQNSNNLTSAATECTAQFGANSEINTMVQAAIKAVQNSNLQTIAYPPIVIIPLANADTSATLSTTLNGLLTTQMPFIASCYAGTDTTAETALQSFVTTISGQNRGRYGQFGSFCFMGVIGTTATATPIGTNAASPNMLFPWLIDSAGTPANSVQQMAAATAAVCAANGLPYMPMTDVVVGGLVPPSSAADWHTPDDSGTESLGLSAGLIPLMSNQNGSVSISRTVTSSCRVSGQQDADYFDLQDWQVLCYLRQQCYNLAQQSQFKIAKASDAVAKALLSGIINICKTMQDDLGMLQYVEKLVGEFTYARVSGNPSAFTYSIPVNVIPGFYNKGIDVIGTDQFDVLVA